jgi:hypothetical protein
MDFECHACILAKSTWKSVLKVHEGKRASTFAKEVHSNLWGLARVLLHWEEEHTTSVLLMTGVTGQQLTLSVQKTRLLRTTNFMLHG